MSADVNEKPGRRRRQTEEALKSTLPVVDDAGLEDEEDGDEADSSLNPRAITAPKGRPTAGRRNRPKDEAEEGNLITRPVSGLQAYLEEVRDELAKVSWPSREEVIRLTRIVLIVTVASAVLLGLIAFGFTALFAQGLENPLIFLIFFAVAGAAAFVLYRNMQADASDDLPTRL